MNIPHLDSATLIARYCVEDNTDEYIEFDIERRTQKGIFISIVKNLFSHFELLPAEKERETERAVKELITKYKFSLAPLFSTEMSIKGIKDVFFEFDIEIDRNMFNFIIMVLYDISTDVNSLPSQEIIRLLIKESPTIITDYIIEQEKQREKDSHRSNTAMRRKSASFRIPSSNIKLIERRLSAKTDDNSQFQYKAVMNEIKEEI